MAVIAMADGGSRDQTGEVFGGEFGRPELAGGNQAEEGLLNLLRVLGPVLFVPQDTGLARQAFDKFRAGVRRSRRSSRIGIGLPKDNMAHGIEARRSANRGF